MCSHLIIGHNVDGFLGDSKNKPLFALQIDDIELVERRGYLTIRFTLPREGGTLLLRKTDGIRKWHQALQVRNRILCQRNEI